MLGEHLVDERLVAHAAAARLLPELVEYAGTRRAVGFNGLVNGSVTSAATVRPGLERAALLGFKGVQAPGSTQTPAPTGAPEPQGDP